MTKEIWAAIIIAIAQITASVVIAGKQINVARELANPDKKADVPRTKTSNFFKKYFRKAHIIIPLLINISLAGQFIYKNGISIYVIPLLIWTFGSLIFQSLMEYILNSIITLSSVTGHILSRLKCHESILFDLTDKPCKEDGICKFDD